MLKVILVALRNLVDELVHALVPAIMLIHRGIEVVLVTLEEELRHLEGGCPLA